MPTTPITITDTGCYLDNHRGHYITRDAVQLAQDYGFIIGPFEQFAVDMYDDHGHEENYPQEGLYDLADSAVSWLNSGQETCPNCDGSGYVGDVVRKVICRDCSGSGRAPRMAGQNFPPIVPAGHVWEFFDGDFGLYAPDDDDTSDDVA